MKHVKFNKTICGVDFLLNVIEVERPEECQLNDEIHTADFFQIVFIEKGSGTLFLDKQKITFNEEQVLFISQFQKYRWQIQQGGFKAKFLVFQENFLNDFFSDQYFTYKQMYFYQTDLPLFMHLDKEEQLQYVNQLNEIRKELINPQVDSVHLIRSILYYLLARLNRTYTSTYKISTSDFNNQLAFKFRMLVEKNIHSVQRVEEYAEMLQVNRIVLNKEVKSQFNQTASDFIKSRLLHEIKLDLIYSTMTVNELADKYHFSESNHLTRFFKKQSGYTPSDFRTAYQNGSI